MNVYLQFLHAQALEREKNYRAAAIYYTTAGATRSAEHCRLLDLKSATHLQ